jgi:hypothetical protein
VFLAQQPPTQAELEDAERAKSLDELLEEVGSSFLRLLASSCSQVPPSGVFAV